MFEDWLDVLERGSYEVAIPALTVTSGEIGTLRGSGQISWNGESEIRIQAATDGGEVLNGLLFGGLGTPGHLIAHSTFLTFAGRTQENWELTADSMPRNGHRTHTNLPDVVWDVHTTAITLQHETTVAMGRLLRILMGPVPPQWVRITETDVRNAAFGHRSSRRDWLSTTCTIGRVSARQRSDKWFEVRVVPDDGQPMCAAYTACTAIARAFGFILGRRCVLRGHEEYNERNQTRRLSTRYPETTSNALLQPLGRDILFLENAERLLGLAIDFFLTDLGDRVAPYLYLCWDTADNSHQTQLAISSICVEGLLRVAAETLGPTQPQVDPADITAFQAWLKTTPAEFSQRFLNRLGGLTTMFRNLSTNEIFRDWVSRNVLGVTRDDSQAWSDTRNPSAHGRVSAAGSQDELQTRVFRHARVANLLNRILLQLMRYRGPYIDYAQSGFPPAEFPYFGAQEEVSGNQATPAASPAEAPSSLTTPAPSPAPSPPETGSS
jgi:hypothetical protein